VEENSSPDVLVGARSADKLDLTLQRSMEVSNEAPPRLPTATGFAARRAVVALREHNINPVPLLERFGLSEQDVNEDQIRVSAAAQARFLESAAEALHDSALGFHLATAVNPRAVGMLFYVTSAAKDLGEAIELFARYLRIVNEAVRVKLTRQDGGPRRRASPRRRSKVSGGAQC
jgi:hypothetical protein